MAQTILYCRVSTSEQTAAHQETQARQAGFKIDQVLSDQGVSGVTVPLADRPQGRRLFDILRSGDTLVVRWVDRLGRNYSDVTDNIREFIRRGVIIRTVINNLTFDGATEQPMEMAIRDAMVCFMAAMAQAQAEAIKEAQRAGIDHAREADRPGVYKGRKPSYSRTDLETVLAMLEKQAGTSEIAKVTNLTRQTVLRIKADPRGADDALKAWGQ
ncbi:recombinase [Rhizobium rhizosphaerae]|uniref:Recombinase n=1 Tax=Xaviernesmea rhizosphaerae TaxID=1672749 RepID=A0ABX3P8S8_9HYPH|nr:recombinase family protein [Xaviernesmea rhizosphaerae]OQP84693.1 recombinase [Xaviernesmea rhizosphaerae]